MRSLLAALMYNFQTLTNGWWHLDWMVVITLMIWT